MAILWKWCLLFVIVAVVSKNAGADLTEEKCEIKVGALQSGFFKFELKNNPGKLGNVEFTLEGKTFTLYLDGTENYVYYSTWLGGILKCKFEEKGLIINDPVLVTEDVNIEAVRGKSVAVAFGGMKVKVPHDDRAHIPLKLKVLKGVGTPSATLTLYGYSPRIPLERGSENWLVVSKSQVQSNEFDVDLKLNANDQVLLTNSDKDKPEIAYKERSVLVCLQETCPFTFGHQKGVSLLIDPVTAPKTEKVSLVIKGKKDLKLEVVDQRQTVAKFYEDIDTVLEGTLTSKPTDPKKPPKVAFTSLQIDDNISFTKDHATFIGKEARGFFTVADGEEVKNIVFHVVPDETSAVTDLTFEINNTKAKSLEDLRKTVRVEKTPQDLYLLRSQVLETGKQPFSIQAQGNTKSHVTITKSTSVGVEILPGFFGRLNTKNPLGLVKKESDKNITLIFELESSSQKEKTLLKVGEDELTVKKSPVFKYLTAADFGEKKEFFVEILEEGAEILVKRIDDGKIPLPEVNPCDPDPCKNGGKCKAGEGKEFTCECAKGFNGTFCGEKEAEVNPCDSKPCKNDGKCKAGEGDKFTCECAKGFEGDTCEEEGAEVNPCDPDPCKNGGKCKAGDGEEVICECAKGFEGTFCGEKKAGNSSTNVKGSFFILFTAFLAFIMN